MKEEVVMLGGRSAFDSAIRLAGGKLVLAHRLEDLESAINTRTAMVYTTWQDDRLQKALEITRKAGIPMLLDDAAGIPPFENLTRYSKLGVDLYCFSGGKGLRGLLRGPHATNTPLPQVCRQSLPCLPSRSCIRRPPMDCYSPGPRRSNPSVLTVFRNIAKLKIVSMTLRAGEDLTVGNRLRQILANARRQTA
jgi:hypothetical protein